MIGPHKKGEFLQSSKLLLSSQVRYGIVIAAGERRFHVLWDDETRSHYPQDYQGFEPAEWPDIDTGIQIKLKLVAAARMAR